MHIYTVCTVYGLYFTPVALQSLHTDDRLTLTNQMAANLQLKAAPVIYYILCGSVLNDAFVLSDDYYIR